MKTIKFFLSSSSELAEERKELADVAMGLTNRMEKEGISIQLVKWEYADSASSEGRKQDEYNQLLSECERCIVMFWRRVGKYTNEELDEAYTLNQKKLNPNPTFYQF